MWAPRKQKKEPLNKKASKRIGGQGDPVAPILAFKRIGTAGSHIKRPGLENLLKAFTSFIKSKKTVLKSIEFY